MSQTLPEQLQHLDASLLTAVVQQDQRSPSFAIVDWQAERLSDKGIINPDGLFRVYGHGRDNGETRPWSVVLKVLHQPNHTPEPANLWYWKRELEAVQSGLFATLPDAICAPRFYGVTVQHDSDWLWMEHLTDAVAAPWRLEEYAYAAHQLGRFNAAYLHDTPLPEAPWLCRGHARTWAEGLPPHAAWDDSIVQRFFSHTLRQRVIQLWAERERFYAMLEWLPQVFSHFDFQRRNLFLRPGASGQQEIVAVDWGLCGIGALGGDLYSLVGSSAVMLEWPPAQLAALDEAVFAAYIDGLGVGGWDGDPRLARLGYTAWLALHWGMALPAGAAFWFAEPMAPRAVRQFGHPVEELAVAWATTCDFALTRADEARNLMARIFT
jgi:hypothetical protein